MVSPRQSLIWNASFLYICQTHSQNWQNSSVVKLNGLWDLMILWKKWNLKDWIGWQILYVFSIRSRWRLPLSGDLYVSIQDISRKSGMSCLPKRSVSLWCIVSIDKGCYAGTRALSVVFHFSNTPRPPRQWFWHCSHEYWLSEGKLSQLQSGETDDYLFFNS